MPTEHPNVPRASSEDGDGTGDERERLTRHRGFATWGERLVPLERFGEEVARHGRSLSDSDRRAESRRFTTASHDGVEPEGPFRKVLVFGGVYNNHLALSAVLEQAREWGAEAIYCLGDFGGFGPNPDKVWPLLHRGLLDEGSNDALEPGTADFVRSIQGNYEQSLASGAEDCNCGYADPRDNHFAEISYRYTAANCSAAFKAHMGTLPTRRRVLLGDDESAAEVLLAHGSPRQVNEFLFESTTPDPFLEVLLEQERADALLCTHTGMHWQRRLASGRLAVNVGVIGRPANDGRTVVWAVQLDLDEAVTDPRRRPRCEFVPIVYDAEALAAEMRAERLPEPFVETILGGWWTTCLEILPAKERARSRH